MKKIYIITLLALIIFHTAYSQDTRSLNIVVKQLGDNCQVGKQYLFLIAIDKYENWFSLKNPVKDAKEIRDILVSRYFIDEVIELYDSDATKSGIIKSFNELQKNLKPHDSLLVFYAGHGHLDEVTNSGYWIPINAGTDSFEQINWLSNTQIRGMLSNIKASHILLISDSCFSGDILDTTRSSVPEISHDYFRKAYSRVSRQVLTSGASETVPDTSEFARQLKLTFERNMYTYLDPLMIYNEVRLGISQTLPLLGNLKGTGHQDGASFLLFLKEEGTVLDENEIMTIADYGNIKIEVKTEGMLYLDGKEKGPVTGNENVVLKRIITGPHELTMRYKQGGKEVKKIIVENNKTILVSFSWEDGIYKDYENKLISLENILKKGYRVKQEDIDSITSIINEIENEGDQYEDVKEKSKALFDKATELKSLWDTLDKQLSKKSNIIKKIEKIDTDKKLKSKISWISLGAGAAFFTLSGISYIMGNTAYDNYMAADTESAVLQYKNRFVMWDTVCITGLGTGLIGGGISFSLFLKISEGERKKSQYNRDLMRINKEIENLEKELK